METIHLKINGMPVSAPKGTTIIEAARQAGIRIPTLCYLKDLNAIGACRVCVVEVKGARSLVASCVYPVAEGMEVQTNTPKVRRSRRTTIELLLSAHNRSCLSCVRSGSCELQKLALDYGVENAAEYAGAVPESTVDDSTGVLIRDNSKCVLCRRCVAACARQQAVAVIGPNDRGFDTHIGCAFDRKLADVPCVSCGQCITVCPTGALHERDDTEKVWEALADPNKHVIVNTAPSVRVTLGECFGMEPGRNVKGKMVAALRRIGFEKVFDTDFSADLTIVEEANELVERIQNGGKLPLITSCSPGWVKFCEYYFPDFIGNLSTCKSPQQMFGAVAKTWYAKQAGIDPKDLFVVSVMPCTAKKFEARRDHEAAAGVPDIDVALTTRELGRMIARAGVDFAALPDEEFDQPLGESTGAGAIFGATGGVMEAALRTAAETLTGKRAENVEYREVRGTAGVKQAVYELGGLTLRVAVASGLANAKRLLTALRAGKIQADFVEIMACPGGCVNGGGQPIQPAWVRGTADLRAVRAAALYEEDRGLPLRRSHENPVIRQLYADLLEKPGSHRAHEVLHTEYAPRKQYP